MLVGLEQTSLVVLVREGSKDQAYWDAYWRYRVGKDARWVERKRRLGLAWQEPDGAGGWRKCRGRCPEGWLDERAANVAAVALLQAHAAELATEADADARAAAELRTVRALAHDWLSWLAEVWGAKPSTVKDYGFWYASRESRSSAALELALGGS